MLDYLVSSRVLTLAASTAITYGLWDQALKIWRSRSANDFTPSLIVALAFNEVAWLNYGVALGEWPILTISLANIPAVLLAILGYCRFRDRRH